MQVVVHTQLSNYFIKIKRNKSKKKKKKQGFRGCEITRLEERTVEEKLPREGRFARNLEAPPSEPAGALLNSDGEDAEQPPSILPLYCKCINVIYLGPQGVK